jgi:catechol 2,3-dioxygenase-like lactoylglutathione lyase family enzyme
MGKSALRLKTTGLDHIVLHVKDMDVSKDFYVGLLGMEVNHEGPGRLFLSCGQQMLGLFEMEGLHRKPVHPDLNHVAFQIESGSYKEVKAALEEHGIEVSGRKGDPHCIYFQDPDGHRLQILTPR